MKSTWWVLLVGATAWAQGMPTAIAQVITTVVGTSYAFPGDGKPAINAPLGYPYGVAVAGDGTVYIADEYDAAVFTVDPSGILHRFAGNGVPGNSGDGGPAVEGTLIAPTQVALAPGNITYILDGSGVRIVDANGVISRVPLSGLSEPVAIAAANGNLYIAEASNSSVIAFNVFSYQLTTVVPAGSLGETPQLLAADANGNLFIAAFDSQQNQDSALIYKLAPNGTLTKYLTITQLPYACMTVDSEDNIYVGGFDEVWKVPPTGNPVLVAGGPSNYGFGGDGGPATAALFSFPLGLAFDSAGNLYIADAQNRRVRKIDASGTINTIAGNNLWRTPADGTNATSAALFDPTNVVVDQAGNLYIAEQQGYRVFKVSAAGQVSTIAGNGARGITTTTVPATQSPLNGPTGVAVDAAGTVYFADSSIYRISTSGTLSTVVSAPPAVAGLTIDAAGNFYFTTGSTVRKMDTTGNVTTIAGTGTPGPGCADGTAALQCTLSDAFGITLDKNGNIFVADESNQRVIKITGGQVFRVAGGNGAGESGNGGPAVSAQLAYPRDLAIGPDGSLYIADQSCSIRRVTADGIIEAVAGVTGTCGFSGDGGPAVQALLGAENLHLVGGASGVTFDSAGNMFFADYGSNRVREVLATPPSFVGPASTGASGPALPASLSLAGSSGGAPVLAAFDIVAQSSSLAIPGVTYSVASDSSWLTASPVSGTTPGLVTIQADPVALQANSYSGNITLNMPNANPPSRVIPVTFAVGPGVPPAISVDQTHLSFTYATTSAPRGAVVVVSNSGGSALNFTASVSLNSGQSANWLSVAPLSGTATPGNPVSLSVSADPTMLPAGTYTGSVTIQGGSTGAVTIPVTMTITTNPEVMLLSQSGLTFTAIQNGGAIPPQTFGVLSLGSGTLNWTAQTSTLQGGNWLAATPDSGSSDSAALTGAPLVTVSVDSAGLQPGIYYGLVKIVSAGAANTPQEVVAVLQVLPAGSDLSPIVLPSSLLFTNVGSGPSSQNLMVYDPTATNKSYRSTFSTADAIVDWVQTLPSDATIPANAPESIVVQPFIDGGGSSSGEILSSGVHTGIVELEFSDGRVAAVPITYVLPGSSAASRPANSPRYSSASPEPRASTSCTPTKLVPVLTSLGRGFTVPAGFPEGLTAQVTDDCGNPLAQGQVSVEFSTGQGLTYMQSLNNGRWDVTWQTGSQQVSSVTLTIQATDPTQTLTGQAQINGALGAIQAPPQVLDRGVVSAASFAATPVAPGGFISIFGSLLSDATSSAPVLPLPTELNNTTVKLGDQALPLFYTNSGSSTNPAQLNALVPYETPVNTSLQLLVQRDNTYATPVYVDVAAAQPGVLEYGNQEAVAVDVNGNLIGPLNPAHAGDLLTMYCLGLGAVTPAVADGAAAPSNPPASTVNTVTVTVGGQTANLIFAGLTPTLAGLYQIDLYVPQNSGTGDQVPVAVSTGGQTSVTVNLSVQ